MVVSSSRSNKGGDHLNLLVRFPIYFSIKDVFPPQAWYFVAQPPGNTSSGRLHHETLSIHFYKIKKKKIKRKEGQMIKKLASTGPLRICKRDFFDGNFFFDS